MERPFLAFIFVKWGPSKGSLEPECPSISLLFVIKVPRSSDPFNTQSPEMKGHKIRIRSFALRVNLGDLFAVAELLEGRRELGFGCRRACRRSCRRSRRVAFGLQFRGPEGVAAACSTLGRNSLENRCKTTEFGGEKKRAERAFCVAREPYMRHVGLLVRRVHTCLHYVRTYARAHDFATEDLAESEAKLSSRWGLRGLNFVQICE